MVWLRASTNAASDTAGLAQVPFGTSTSGATMRRCSRLGTAASSRAKRAAPRVFAALGAGACGSLPMTSRIRSSASATCSTIWPIDQASGSRLEPILRVAQLVRGGDERVARACQVFDDHECSDLLAGRRAPRPRPHGAPAGSMSRSYAAPPQGPSSAHRATADRRAADAHAHARTGPRRHAGAGGRRLGPAGDGRPRRRSRRRRARRRGAGAHLHAGGGRALPRHRLFPRRRLRHRRPRDARSAVPPDRGAHRRDRLRGRLPPRARASVPGRGRRRARRGALVPGARRGARRRSRSAVRHGRQRRRHAGDGDGARAARAAEPAPARPDPDLSDHRSRRRRRRLLRRVRRRLRPDPRRHALVHAPLHLPIRPTPPTRASARCGCRPCAGCRRRSS